MSMALQQLTVSCGLACIPFRRTACQSHISCASFEPTINNKNAKLKRPVEDTFPLVQIHTALDWEPNKTSNWHEDALKAGFAIGCWALLGMSSTAECVWAEQALPISPEVSSSKPVTLGRMFSGKIGYSFFYPEGFIVATNRKGDDDRQADGSQAIALVGNFSSFDTISVIRFPFGDTDINASPSDLAAKLLTRGNVRTNFISATKREQSDVEELDNGPLYVYEYVTEVCRGNLEEGKGGLPDCVSPNDGSLLSTVIRHHVASVTIHEGEFYVISASSAEARWEEMASALRAAVSSFSFV